MAVSSLISFSGKNKVEMGKRGEIKKHKSVTCCEFQWKRN